MRIRRGWTVVAVAALVTVFPAPRAKALFGIGDIVLDPSNLAQAVAQVANQVQQLANDAIEIANQGTQIINQGTQIANQIQQIELTIRNLENLDFSTFSNAVASLNQIRDAYSTSVSRVHTAIGAVESIYNTVYRDDQSLLANVADFVGLADHRKDKALNSRDVNRASAVQASRTVDAMLDRQGRVQQIASVSDNAAGTKAAVQSSTLLVGEVLGELQNMHLSLLAAERREATQAADEIDEQLLAGQQHEQFWSDATNPHISSSASVPTR